MRRKAFRANTPNGIFMVFHDILQVRVVAFGEMGFP